MSRIDPTTSAGTSARSSTRSSCAASRTATATAPATCPGLIEKLDYLEWLGIDCIWLLPFYKSPLRDGGYDISDFFTIHPSTATSATPCELVEEAHRRGIRIVADLVMNHTSRPAPVVPGVAPRTGTTPWPTGTSGPTTTSVYQDARIIFVDTEPSNWT